MQQARCVKVQSRSSATVEYHLTSGGFEAAASVFAQFMPAALCARRRARGGNGILLDVTDGSVRKSPQPSSAGWSMFAPRLRGEGTVARRAWRSAYVRRAAVADLACAAVAALVGYLVRFGSVGATQPRPSFWGLLLLPAVWVAAMLVARSYEERFLWVGPEEFRRVVFAAALLLSAVGTVSWALKLEVARGFVIVALPLATLLTLAHRYAHRQWVHHEREHGRYQQTTLLVGHRSAVAALDEQIGSETYHGYRVIGCCLPRGEQNPAADAFHGLPVLGRLDD